MEFQPRNVHKIDSSWEFISYLQKAKSLLAKKEEGNKEFRTGNYHEAYKIYTEALEIDPNNKFTNSKLYCNRATVCSKVSKIRAL